MTPLFSGLLTGLLLLLSPLAQADKITEELFQNYKNAVVQVETTLAGFTIAHGTGFIVNEGQYIVTNVHVVQSGLMPGTQIQISTYDKKIFPESKIQVVACNMDRKPDICVLSVGPLTAHPFHFAPELPNQGSDVFTIGHPHDYPYSISKGMTNGVRRDSHDFEVIQFNAPISNGNSGGPLFNEKGNVVGIVTYAEGGSAVSQNLNFAYSYNEIRKEIKSGMRSGNTFSKMRANYQDFIKQFAISYAAKFNIDVRDSSPSSLKDNFFYKTYEPNIHDVLADSKKRADFWTPKNFKCKSAWSKDKKHSLTEICTDEKNGSDLGAGIVITGKMMAQNERAKERRSYESPQTKPVVTQVVAKLFNKTHAENYKLNAEEKEVFYQKTVFSKCRIAELGGNICESEIHNVETPGHVFFTGYRDFPDSNYVFKITAFALQPAMAPFVEKLGRAVLDTARLHDRSKKKK